MFSSPIDARDSMFQHFADAFGAVSLVGDLDVETRWQGRIEAAIPDGYFVRVSTKNEGSPLGGFADQDKVYDSFGNLFVQVFAPINAEDAYRNGELLSIAARDIFRQETEAGVWFRNARYNELESDGKFYRWNVIVEFEFSEG